MKTATKDKFWQFRNLNADEGELLLYGNIASKKPWWDDSAEGIYPKQFADDLKALGGITKLTVRLNSNGGDVFAAHAIFTQLKSHMANVTAVIDGIAASAATIIMAAADTIKAPSNALIMIHDPMLMLFGYYNTQDMSKMMDVLATVKDSIVNTYVAKTGLDKADLADMMKNETWMTGEEAKDKGFVDEIMFEENIDATVTNDGRFLVVNSIAHDMQFIQNKPVPNNSSYRFSQQSTTVNNRLEYQKPPKKEEQELDIKNIEDLKKNFPDLCNQLIASTQEAAAAAERERIKAIDDIAQTVSKELVNKAKYEEPKTAQDLAFEALKSDASKGRQFRNEREEELDENQDVEAEASKNQKEQEEAAVVDVIVASLNKKRQKGDNR